MIVNVHGHLLWRTSEYIFAHEAGDKKGTKSNAHVFTRNCEENAGDAEDEIPKMK